MTKKLLRSNPDNTQARTLTLLEMQPLPAPVGFEEVSGPLAYRMTNDAMFHIVFEAHPESLKGLVGALLRRKQEEIISIQVTNPVTFNMVASAKTFVLDLKILLNGNSVVNLEMQVEKLSFWKERSLGYLCRAFDSLNRGGAYLDVKSAIQVGILDFDLAPEDTAFYSTYYMLNEITHKKYSDKLRLSVLQLRQVENATEEDRAWHLDLWAKFFKAKTWEEVFMIAEKDPYIANAAQTLYRASVDERIRNFCEGREEGEKTLRTLQIEVQQSKREAQQSKEEAQQSKMEAQQSKKEAQQSKMETQQFKIELQQKDSQLTAALARIAELEAMKQ